MKRIILFLATNLAVMLVLGVTASLLGVNKFLTANGLNLGALLVFAALMGFGGAFISLFMSKAMAKWSTGARVITSPGNSTEFWLVQTVERLSQRAGIAMPEVAIYDGEPCTQIVIRLDDGKVKAAMLAEQLKAVTSLDALTGLPNRQRFEESLEESLILVRRAKTHSALLFMTVYNVPQINASAVIVCTDGFISALSGLLRDNLPEGSLARFSDSSFATILPETSTDEARVKAEKLCQG